MTLRDVLRLFVKRMLNRFCLTLLLTNNRCVFSRDLKVARDGLYRKLFGREFHRVGETKQKDRLAKSD